MRRRPLSSFSPPVLIAGSFAALSLAGALLLALPIAHAPGQALSPLQALFTATSAACLVGLSAVNIGEVLSLFGQTVVLLLMQLGGLAIVTFGTLFASLAGRAGSARPGLTEQPGLPDSAARLVRTVALSGLALELAGAALLYGRFGPAEGWGRGAYLALFYAVSALNNGGFGLNAAAVRLQDPLVGLTLSALTLLGGLGFVVVANVLVWRAAPRRRGLQTASKIALWMTGALLLLGMLVLAAVEWHNPATLGPLPPGRKVLASFLESVTARSAGFAALDTASLRPASALALLLLMFVGASPASTGGGIKVTTFFVALLMALSLLRGREAPSAFRRRIDPATGLRALAAALLGFALVNVGLWLLLLAEPGLNFLDVLFEAVSAYGSAGLSRGITPRLGEGGQAAVLLLMYLGRITPLIFALWLGRRAPPEAVSYPAEPHVPLG